MKKSAKCAWYTIISWICKFLSTIYQKLLENCTIIYESNQKMMKFAWNVIYEHIFNDLKKQFTTILILAHFDSNLKYILKADLFDHVQENMLLQYDKNNVLQSIAYFLQKLNAVKSNYEIYDKELLAIIWCFE